MNTLKTLTASIPEFEIFRNLNSFLNYCDESNIKQNNKLRSDVEMLCKLFKQSNIKVTGIILSKDMKTAFIETGETMSDPIPLQTIGQFIARLNSEAYLKLNEKKKYQFNLQAR